MNHIKHCRVPASSAPSRPSAPLAAGPGPSSAFASYLRFLGLEKYIDTLAAIGVVRMQDVSESVLVLTGLPLGPRKKLLAAASACAAAHPTQPPPILPKALQGTRLGSPQDTPAVPKATQPLKDVVNTIAACGPWGHPQGTHPGTHTQSLSQKRKQPVEILSDSDEDEVIIVQDPTPSKNSPPPQQTGTQSAAAASPGSAVEVGVSQALALAACERVYEGASLQIRVLSTGPGGLAGLGSCTNPGGVPSFWKCSGREVWRRHTCGGGLEESEREWTAAMDAEVEGDPRAMARGDEMMDGVEGRLQKFNSDPDDSADDPLLALACMMPTQTQCA